MLTVLPFIYTRLTFRPLHDSAPNAGKPTVLQFGHTHIFLSELKLCFRTAFPSQSWWLVKRSIGLSTLANVYVHARSHVPETVVRSPITYVTQPVYLPLFCLSASPGPFKHLINRAAYAVVYSPLPLLPHVCNIV